MQVPGELVFTEKMVKGKKGGVQRLLRDITPGKGDDKGSWAGGR